MTNVGQNLRDYCKKIRTEAKALEEIFAFLYPQLVNIYENLKKQRLWHSDINNICFCIKDGVCKMIDFEKSEFDVPLSSFPSLSSFLDKIYEMLKIIFRIRGN